ncbi:hypothetical protein DFP72DRAFT_841118 [Ephemerocybe angulata]|uniref:Uncharacterized protein n=1 Tax=Ephemerocybe angulata TaxID=980116 RepID=A0A8H6ICB0_9AGAR|nr:hypothetical protein DFP72DRAFT_841118 [Tulosesus angulatus]
MAALSTLRGRSACLADGCHCRTFIANITAAGAIFTASSATQACVCSDAYYKHEITPALGEFKGGSVRNGCGGFVLAICLCWVPGAIVPVATLPSIFTALPATQTTPSVPAAGYSTIIPVTSSPATQGSVSTISQTRVHLVHSPRGRDPFYDNTSHGLEEGPSALNSEASVAVHTLNATKFTESSRSEDEAHCYLYASYSKEYDTLEQFCAAHPGMHNSTLVKNIYFYRFVKVTLENLGLSESRQHIIEHDGHHLNVDSVIGSIGHLVAANTFNNI